MSDFSGYMSAQKDTALARQQHETASVKIELCQIRERAAEVRSQHQPLADYIGVPLTRDALLEIVNYVMIGRKTR